MQFIDDARRLGAEQLFLEVRVGNAGAIALYERDGFAPVARRVGVLPADARRRRARGCAGDAARAAPMPRLDLS